jgi:hypothetical protein
MIVTLSPIAANKTTTVSISGLTLTIDGVDHDLSVIPVGGQADGEAPFVGVVTRDECTVQYFYDSSKAEPNQSTDWNDYTFDIDSGEVPCPIIWKPVMEVSNNDI